MVGVDILFFGIRSFGIRVGLQGMLRGLVKDPTPYLATSVPKTACMSHGDVSNT